MIKKELFEIDLFWQFIAFFGSPQKKQLKWLISRIFLNGLGTSDELPFILFTATNTSKWWHWHGKVIAPKMKKRINRYMKIVLFVYSPHAIWTCQYFLFIITHYTTVLNVHRAICIIAFFPFIWFFFHFHFQYFDWNRRRRKKGI